MDKPEISETATTYMIQLYKWQKKLTDFQKGIIQKTWQNFIETRQWALLRPIYREYGKSKVVEALSDLAGLLREEEDHQAGNRLQLHLPGITHTDDGIKYIVLVERYFSFQYDLFMNESEIRQINSDEIATRLKITNDETKILGLLLNLGGLLGGNSPDFRTWSVRSMKEVEDFSPGEGLNSQVEKWINKSYFPDNPVFVEARMQLQLINSPSTTISWPANPNEPQKEEYLRPIEGNPFQRRYQVFVSSTYIDLIEERKHVMQALLETKCIPSGMEMFPAASMEQMKLIHGVIDDCDYYLVIVAGKYGSCGPTDISYTEMEFDYAISKGKPILAFFYNDIKKLTGDKLEETDSARKKLAEFTNKLKNQRMCRSWSTADGLASAIKTAVIHVIETNPKPGWVRADSVPTWKMVQSLEDRIAHLEGRSYSATFAS